MGNIIYSVFRYIKEFLLDYSDNRIQRNQNLKLSKMVEGVHRKSHKNKVI